MVIDVMTDTAYPPKDVMTLMSAWIPAPPEPSEPVIVNIVLRCFMLRRPPMVWNHARRLSDTKENKKSELYKYSSHYDNEKVVLCKS